MMSTREASCAREETSKISATSPLPRIEEPRHAAQAPEHAAQRLDDGLVLAQQLVDQHAEALAARLDHHHAHALGLAASRVHTARAG
jgi:hypothetical protein